MARLAAVLATVAAAAATVVAVPAQARAARMVIPRSADQLIVVSSPTTDPSDYLATFRAYQRANSRSPWRPVFGSWQAETGSGHLLPGANRREGDHATPIGVYTIGVTMYGNKPNPGGLQYSYHRLTCGDWWDEDPYSAQYSRFVHVACGVTPGFAAWSEPLWTETLAYPYLAVIDFNTGRIRAGAGAPGSGIFLHSWMDAPTEGCVALPESRLLAVLRWLRPPQHPVIEIATDAELAPL
ncbi:MAG TPA: L,D-transpeptidase family protein [Solirubrobacteraceae bacterium]|nr:L,D-transpeptidase family protein [Solirubrobacteraceae bacterium]